MTLDRDIVVVRLQMMKDLLADLESLGDVDGARLRTERITRHAIERILTQLVESAVSINSHVAAAVSGVVPATYRESFFAAVDAGFISLDLARQLAPSAGLRNVLTHEYVTVDLDLVAAAVGRARADYSAYVTAVAQGLRGR